MAKKIQRGLGRGLGALLGEDVVAEAAAEAEAAKASEGVEAVRMLPIGQIDPNRESSSAPMASATPSSRASGATGRAGSRS